MAIAYLSASVASNSSATSSTTSWSYDSLTSGSDRCLVVGVVYENNTTADVTAITYNGVNLTFQDTYVDDGGGFAETIEVWTLVAPATGSNTLAVTLSQTGRDLGVTAAVFTGVDQTTPVGNTALSAQYSTATGINADLTFAANSMDVYLSSTNRSNVGPMSARTGNTQIDSYVTATGNSGFGAAMGYRGPESSSGTYNCGSDATTNSVGGGCVAIELLEASAGGSYTLTADSGSYTLTGTAASLTADRALSAESGTYALTGTSAELNIGVVLSADSGTYTLTGTNAGLTADRIIDASSGTYLLTGTDATLTYTPATGDYNLVAESGAFSLSGTSASLLAGRALSAGSGSYTLSGTSVDLNTGYSLSAESGAFTLTGTNIDFSKTSVLSADSGAYVLTGSSVDFTYSGALAWTVQVDSTTTWTTQTDDTSNWTIQ